MINLNLYWLDYVVKAVTEKFVLELKAIKYVVIYNREDGILLFNLKVDSENTVRLTVNTGNKSTFKLELLRLGEFSSDTEFKDGMVLTYEVNTEDSDNLASIVDANSKISSKLSEWLPPDVEIETNTKSLTSLNRYLEKTMKKVGTDTEPNNFYLEIIVNTEEFDLSYSNNTVYIDAMVYEGKYNYKEKHKGLIT